MKPIPIAEINRELVPKDPLEQAQFGAALFEKCRLAHNAEPKTSEGKQRQKTLWLPRIRAACKLIAEARMLLPKRKDELELQFDKRQFLQSDKGARYLGLIDIGKSFEKTQIHDTPDIDPLEDFTTYTEVDPNNRFSIAQHTITATNLSRAEDAYIYRDCGTGHFGEFAHYFQTSLTSVSGSNHCAVTFWGISNLVDDCIFWVQNRSQALHCFYWRGFNGTELRLYLRNTEKGYYDDYTIISLNTMYYPVAERSGASAFAHIYTDTGRTTLLDTLSVALDSARTYRYIFAANSFNDGYSTSLMSFTVSNLDLSEFQPAWAEGINTHHF